MTGFLLISVVLAAVFVDGSPLLTSFEQPTPFKYTVKVEKLEFGDGVEDCTECDGDGRIIIGDQEEPVDPYGDQGASVCEFLKHACIGTDYPDQIEDNPEAKRLFTLMCINYEDICGGNEPDGSFIPNYPDIDQGARVCMELEKACFEGFPEEIENNPEEKKMLSLMCMNYEYICGENESEDYFTPDPSVSFCGFLEEVCSNEEEVPEELRKNPENYKIYLLTCKNYDYICGETDDDEAEETEEPDEKPEDFAVTDHPVDEQKEKACQQLKNICEDEDYIDSHFENPKEKEKILSFCNKYDKMCGENSDDEEDIYSEFYEEVFDQEEENYFTDEDDEEEDVDEPEEDIDNEESESNRNETAGGALKRRNALGQKKITRKLKRTASMLPLLTKRDRST